MDRQRVITELKNIIGDYLKIQGLDLIDVIYRYEGRDLILRVLTDKPQGGITLEECAQLNKQISNILDEKDILQTRYVLEVSSPGLDRWLKTKSDFGRCINRKVRFFLNEAISGKMECEGIINKVENNAVCVDSDDKIIEIPLLKIIKAKQVIDIR
jgi:ribosome maturation factor RimP